MLVSEKNLHNMHCQKVDSWDFWKGPFYVRKACGWDSLKKLQKILEEQQRGRLASKTGPEMTRTMLFQFYKRRQEEPGRLELSKWACAKNENLNISVYVDNWHR